MFDKRTKEETSRPMAIYRLPDGKMVDYATYRELTGKCETCDAQMDTHPKCDACGALCGEGHLEALPSPYQGHNLCGHCIGFWKGLDKVTGRETTWNEFLGGKTLLPKKPRQRESKASVTASV